MKIGDMTTDMIMACALKCPIKLPHGKGAVKVEAGSGDWFAYRAKTELTKRWRKACIEDLRQRELRGGSYPGDVGHCVIGGKKFSLYPKSGMLIRDDFALWAEAHIDEIWDFHLHRQRLPDKPPENETVTVDPQLKMFKDIRQRALKMKDVDDLVEPGLWNTQYDMKKTLSEYALDIKRNERNGRVYISVKMLADLLAAQIAYREKHYSDSISFFLDLSADALKAAQFIQSKAAKEC